MFFFAFLKPLFIDHFLLFSAHKGDNTHESLAVKTVRRVPHNEGRIEVVLGRTNLPTVDSGVSILRSSLNSCKNPSRSNRDILRLEEEKIDQQRKSSQSLPELDIDGSELDDWVFPPDPNSNDTKIRMKKMSENELRDKHYYVNGYKVPLNRVIKINN